MTTLILIIYFYTSNHWFNTNNNQYIIYIKNINLNYIVQGLDAVRETTDICCNNYRKHKNAFCEQNLELLNIKADLFDITTVL